MSFFPFAVKCAVDTSVFFASSYSLNVGDTSIVACQRGKLFDGITNGTCGQLTCLSNGTFDKDLTCLGMLSNDQI